VELDKENRDFWDELCGSEQAKRLGIDNASQESLEKYDSWYFSHYPYLQNYFKNSLHKDGRVLEIGLGFGTMSQWMGSKGAIVTGLDIAQGPLKMFNSRFASTGLQGEGVEGSILSPPLKNESFDLVVAIGSLHHTGDLAKSISQCRALLKENGTLILMVYNAYSYRRWLRSLWATLQYLFSELSGYRGVVGKSRKNDRALYDTDTSGQPAPHTDWVSKRSLNHLLRDFSDRRIESNNLGVHFPSIPAIRSLLLRTGLARVIGLDLYAIAKK
jgi:SAM-dependent methyltransferase